MRNSDHHTLKFRVSGNGYPVVFLHGFLESMSMWSKLNFKNDFQRIEVDLPGHGDSKSILEQDLSMKSIAATIIYQLNELGIENYALVGHSLGGYIGIEMMKMDARLEKMVFLNSNFWGDDAQKINDRQRIAKIVLRNKTSFIYEAIPHLFLDPTKYHDEVVTLINEAKQISAKTIADYSIAMSQREDNTDFVCENATKIMVIQGGEDTIVSEEKMSEFALKCPFQYVKLSPCGHMLHFEQKKKVEKEILDFLALSED